MAISSFQCYTKNATEFFVEVFVLNQKTIFVGASVMSRSRYQYKTGIKLIIVVSTAVSIAPETSVVAWYTTVFTGNWFLFSSKCLMMFSDKITPTSTIVPIAMAIPDSATILASTPNNFIAINTCTSIWICARVNRGNSRVRGADQFYSKKMCADYFWLTSSPQMMNIITIHSLIYQPTMCRYQDTQIIIW